MTDESLRRTIREQNFKLSVLQKELLVARQQTSDDAVKQQFIDATGAIRGAIFDLEHELANVKASRRDMDDVANHIPSPGQISSMGIQLDCMIADTRTLIDCMRKFVPLVKPTHTPDDAEMVHEYMARITKDQTAGFAAAYYNRKMNEMEAIPP